MGKERAEQSSADQIASGIRVTRVSLDLEQRSISFTTDDRRVATFRLAPKGLIFESPFSRTSRPDAVDAPTSHTVETATSHEPSQQAAAENEKARASIFQGKLKSKPIPGRPDARGNPTAWARFAAHDPDQDGAHLYSTTFHRHTVDIALSLDKESQLTVQGFPHEQSDPNSRRLDTLSVINLLDYPGKQKDE